MYTEIGCFVACVCGWILVCSTMPTNYWTYSEVDSLVLTSGHYFSNLWKDCLSDSTGVTDCKEFPTLLALQTYIHLCRSLVIVSIILGFFGSILALVGMKCTKLGGSEIVNARVTFAAGMNYLFSGLCGMFAYSCYAHKVISEFMDPNYKAKNSVCGMGRLGSPRGGRICVQHHCREGGLPIQVSVHVIGGLNHKEISFQPQNL
uniref:Claudin n=1 Tax=Sinocyclocheilus grahami TaxID=75366 RepID=A0A672RJE0_SINGR